MTSTVYIVINNNHANRSKFQLDSMWSSWKWICIEANA